jgi:alanyl-tRNA synthetase
MTASEIRQKYLQFMQARGHKLIPRALLVPQDDPTTLFTGSGMQPLVPYLLGQPHPDGNRLVDSQTCFRAEDMDEVGDNRHTTFFEMLGNWSLGDYYKDEQLPWFWEFLTKELNLPEEKLWVTCFEGDEALNIPRDDESAAIWRKLGVPEERIKFYGAEHNWWSREGTPVNMRDGEPGGPDSEVFYEFTQVEHDTKYGDKCHPNCDCGRFLEIGNSVFMTYRKLNGKFEQLPKPNVDFGGGLERIAAAVNDDPDVFKISLIKPIIDHLEELSGKKYDDHKESMRVVADHIRAAVFLIADGVAPSNKSQGYVLRRLLRRAILFARELKLADNFGETVPQIAVNIYETDFEEIKTQKNLIVSTISKEAKIFTQTLERGHLRLLKLLNDGSKLTGENIFELHDTYGFPPELTLEVAKRGDHQPEDGWQKVYDVLRDEQRQRSQTASAGMFKGGLADHSEEVVKLHTTTHLMYQALKNVLGDHVVQRGSNITAERTRFDFSHPEKVTREQLDEVEKIVNQKIAEDLPVTWQEEKTDEAFKKGASGAFGDKYGDVVKVYTIGDPANPFSREICGGPHVEHTGVIGDGGKQFKITKEEASSAGVRRVKAVLQ